MEQPSIDSPLEFVHVAPTTRTDGERPAVIVLHGRGANEDDLLPIADVLPDDLEIFSVRAPEPLGPGFTWYGLDLSRGGLHASQPDPEDYERSLNYLDEFIQQASEAHTLDPDRIGLLGFSQGAILALGALVTHDRDYNWIAALHGYLPERFSVADLAAAPATPIFIAGGEHDEVIPPTRAEDAAERLTAAGHDVTFRVYSLGHGIASSEVDDLVDWVANHHNVPADQTP